MDGLLNEPGYKNIKLVCLAPRDVSRNPVWQNIEFRKVGINHGNVWEQIDLIFLREVDYCFHLRIPVQFYTRTKHSLFMTRLFLQWHRPIRAFFGPKMRSFLIFWHANRDWASPILFFTARTFSLPGCIPAAIDRYPIGRGPLERHLTGSRYSRQNRVI
jgi:hypothetical protein